MIGRGPRGQGSSEAGEVEHGARSPAARYSLRPMNALGLLTIGLSIVGFGAWSRRAERTPVTPAMVFVSIGLLSGPLGFGFIEAAIERPLVHVLAEVTLTLVLFTDASRISLGALRREGGLPLRLLAVGMPLTIVAGTLVAVPLFGTLSLWECAVLAAILAPTDAALGMSVIHNERVPARIRQALNVESGLNDGIAFPIFLVLLSLAGASGEAEGATRWTRFVATQLVLGPVVGAAVGYFGGKLVDRTSRAGWMSHSFQEMAALGLALIAFAGAELVGGNGFIAAFTAGLALGNSSRTVCTCLWDFGETEGQLLALLVFLALGAVLLPDHIGVVGWSAILYSALSLTLVRMIPTAIGLLGTGLRASTTVFLGWFGPRGIASLVFVLLLVDRPGVGGRDLIAGVALLTVLISVFAHGLTAYPGSRWYGGRADAMKGEGASAEHAPVTEMRTRIAPAR